jgi:hypothetical protein
MQLLHVSFGEFINQLQFSGSSAIMRPARQPKSRLHTDLAVATSTKVRFSTTSKLPAIYQRDSLLVIAITAI